VDFGAGTGRLALPLAADGYDVVAVEPSAPMAEQIRTKATSQGIVCPQIKIETIGRCERLRPADTAICVFTVINYVHGLLGLKAAFPAFARALRPGGRLLLDITDQSLFQSYSVRQPGLDRVVDVTPDPDGYRYHYRETTHVEINGDTVTYEDEFDLWFWPYAALEHMWTTHGFTLLEEVTHRIPGAGAQYVVLQKNV